MPTDTQAPNISNAPAEAKAKVVAIIPGKFSGMLANFQVNAYGTMVSYGVSKQVAHKIATDFGSDMGNAMKSDAEFNAKVAKASKDGQSNINFGGKGKTTHSRAMSVVRVCQVLHGLAKEKLIVKATIKPSDFVESVAEYFGDCEAWVNEQTWADAKKTAE